MAPYIVDAGGRLHFEEAICPDCEWDSASPYARFLNLEQAQAAQRYLRMDPCASCLPADDIVYFQKPLDSLRQN
jgi:hypothetical protein